MHRLSTFYQQAKTGYISIEVWIPLVFAFYSSAKVAVVFARDSPVPTTRGPKAPGPKDPLPPLPPLPGCLRSVREACQGLCKVVWIGPGHDDGLGLGDRVSDV